MQFVYAAQMIILMLMPLIQFVLKAIGIGFVTYAGSNLVISMAKDYLLANAGQMTMPLQQILGLAKLDVAVNIYFAAVTTRMVLSGLNKLQDRRRAQVWRAPGGTSIEA